MNLKDLSPQLINQVVLVFEDTEIRFQVSDEVMIKISGLLGSNISGAQQIK